MQKDICKIYNKAGYDFRSFVVSECLGHVSHSANNEDQYICTSCDKRLQETSNENPVLPYYGKYPHAVAGANFLKALNKRPEYVCTCCHRMLFHKTVQLFHTTQYDMSDETVKQCLSHRYVMKLHMHTSQVNDEMRTHEWPQFVQDVVEHDDIDTMDEYICICCKNSLQQKKTKMPDQACANGLQLHDIPQDLQNIMPLERRVISPQIPFITILIMRRYGGHYKVNGPPVNVPATLDQIIDILPHMPSNLQLHPIKLKCKLEYKSHYMYDMIHRDHVISAITWLKEHNSHYADIQLNEHWYNDIAAKEQSVQIDENDSHITMTDDDIFDQPLQKENTSTDKLNTKDNEQLCTKQRESTNVGEHEH